MVSRPSSCPRCKAQLDGDELPSGVKSIFDGVRRYSRVVAIFDSHLDHIVAWRCPDCGLEWARTEVPADLSRWEISRYSCGTDRKKPWAMIDKDPSRGRWYWVAFNPKKGQEEGWCDTRESAMQLSENWMSGS